MYYRACNHTPTVHCRPMRWTDLAVTVSSHVFLACQLHKTKQTCLVLPITTSNIKVEKKGAEQCRIKVQFCRVYWRWSNLAWILTRVAICCNDELCALQIQTQVQRVQYKFNLWRAWAWFFDSEMPWRYHQHYVKKGCRDNKESDLTPRSKPKSMEIKRSNFIFFISSSIQSFLVELNQKFE